MRKDDMPLVRMFCRAFDCAWLDGRNYAFHTSDASYSSAILAADCFITHHAGAMGVRIEYSKGRWVFLIEANEVCTEDTLLT